MEARSRLTYGAQAAQFVKVAVQVAWRPPVDAASSSVIVRARRCDGGARRRRQHESDDWEQREKSNAASMNPCSARRRLGCLRGVRSGAKRATAGCTESRGYPVAGGIAERNDATRLRLQPRACNSA